MALSFGVFEKDNESTNRNEKLTKLISRTNAENILKKCKEFISISGNYFSGMYQVLSNNFDKIDEINLVEIENKWEEIEKYVDKKSLENIRKYLEISSRRDSFDTYMEMHNIDKGQYEKIFEYMEARTKTSMPDFKGKTLDDYQYEMLDFTDIRVLRFGNKEGLDNCQQIGSNAESVVINSAIEATSRIILVKDEKDEAIAGSFVTHRIGKEGSYVCFDSIEVKAGKMGISVKQYSKLKSKIKKLYKNGKLKGLDIESIKKYGEESKEKRNKQLEKGKKLKVKDKISEKELNTLKKEEKIRKAYDVAIEEMIEKDKKIRDEQLEKGEITKEEYDRLLMKNGIFTAGNRSFSKLWLEDLETINKSDKQLILSPQKDMGLYNKLSSNKALTLAKKAVNLVLGTGSMIAGGVGIATSLYVTAAMAPAFAIMIPISGIPILFGAVVKKALKFSHHNGIYTDAMQDQKILYDGRDGQQEEIEKEKQEELNKKLVYTRDKIFMPVKVNELTEEQKKNISRVQEVTDRKQFNENDNEKMVMGSKNWYMLFSQGKDGITINDAVMAGNKKMQKDNGKDSQEDLLMSLKELIKSATKNGRQVTFDIADKGTNKFCQNYADKVVKEINKEQEREEQMRQREEQKREREGMELAF